MTLFLGMAAAMAATQPPLVAATEVDPVTYETYLRLAPLYPAAALRLGIEGRAEVDCEVAARSALLNCKVVTDTPGDQGFGSAAVQIAQTLRVNDKLPARSRSDGPVRLTIRFRVPWSADDAPGSTPSFTLRAGFTYLQKPGPMDMANGYPRSAAARNVQGVAIIRCHVQGDGHMGGCVTTREEPGGVGFGDAALRLAPLFRVDMTKGAGPVAEGKEIDIPVRWTLPR